MGDREEGAKTVLMSREQGRAEVRTERQLQRLERRQVRRVAALSRPLKNKKGSPGRGHPEAKKEA